MSHPLLPRKDRDGLVCKSLWIGKLDSDVFAVSTGARVVLFATLPAVRRIREGLRALVASDKATEDCKSKPQLIEKPVP